MQNTAQLIAVILLASFAIERIGAAASFSLEPSPEDLKGQRRRKLLLSALAGTLALAVVNFSPIRILAQLSSPAPIVDYWLSWLVLFAGADRIKEFLGGVGGSSAPKEQKKDPIPPIKIVVDDGVSARVA